MHWAIEYLGKPWQSGKDGPDTFDCWGLVRYVQRRHFNLELPEIRVDADNLSATVQAFSSHAERQRWSAVIAPNEGDCLLLSQHKAPTHVGVWLDVDGGGLLHAVRGAGVVFTKNSHLKSMGYHVLGAYRCLPA